MKHCYKCKVVQSLDNFSKDKTTVSGLNASCKLCVKMYRIQYEEKNADLIKNKKHEFYLKNKEKVNKRNAQWKKNNPHYARDYQRRKKLEDPIFKLKNALRQRLSRAIKKNYKKGSAVKDLGCDIVFLKNYLESKFKTGMSWQNHGLGKGKWNIDHIRPLSSFDLLNTDEIKKACHYTNLQPLWFEENMSKGNKI